MTNKHIQEPMREIPVYDECDILVVGGGAAGHSAAIAAARAGCSNIILMERYGYMGGDVTGGYVIMVPNLSWYGKSFVRGLQEEWFTRLSRIPGAVLAPALDQIGSTDPALLRSWGAIHDCVSRGGYGGAKPSCLVRSVYFEPNQLKIELDKMLAEHSDAIRVLYHSMGVMPYMEGDAVRGVIFESKEGRKVVLAKTVIDATGDGDLYSRAGAPMLRWQTANVVPAQRHWCGASAAATGTATMNGSLPIRRRRWLCAPVYKRLPVTELFRCRLIRMISVG